MEILTQETVFVRIAMNAWELNLTRATKLINELTDDQLMNEISTGRNRGIYLLGHLIAVHDATLQVLGIAERKYAHLDTAFIHNPDKSGHDMPPVAELRKNWVDIHETMAQAFSILSPADWFTKHTAISAEDFERQPHRNKLSVMVTRTNHLSYHFGQLALLKNK